MADGHRARFSWVRRLMKLKNNGVPNGIGHPLMENRNTHNMPDTPVSDKRPDVDAMRSASCSPELTNLNGMHDSRSAKQNDEISSHRSVEDESYEDSLDTTSMLSQLQSLDSRHSRVQILDNRRTRASHDATTTTPDNESIASKKTSSASTKRRSNSNFTIPSVSKTSITTLSDNASTHTVPSSLLPFHQQHLLETASIITIASSSKHHNRRSFDTNASTMALAPESIMSRDNSIDSYPLQTNKSISSSKMLSDGDDDVIVTAC